MYIFIHKSFPFLALAEFYTYVYTLYVLYHVIYVTISCKSSDGEIQIKEKVLLNTHNIRFGLEF